MPDFENVIAVCPCCIKKQKDEANQHMERIITSTHIKMEFKDDNCSEHMWVLLYNVDLKNRTFKGKLHSQPVLLNNIEEYDDVQGSFNDIELFYTDYDIEPPKVEFGTYSNLGDYYNIAVSLSGFKKESPAIDLIDKLIKTSLYGKSEPVYREYKDMIKYLKELNSEEK